MKKAPATITAAGAGTYKIRLEAVGIFRGELLLGFFNTGAEGRSLDADDLGNCFIGQTLQAESSDFPRFRHQLVQTGKEMVELSLVADDLFDRRCSVGQRIQRRARITVFVLRRVVEGDVVSRTTEFTGQAICVAEPELILRADALAV